MISRQYFVMPLSELFLYISVAGFNLRSTLSSKILNFVKRIILSEKISFNFLIQLKNDSWINADYSFSNDAETSSGILKSVSITQCAKQVFFFHVTGFDTSSTSMIACMKLYKIQK